MSVAVMQPYFMPYLGYLRLCTCVEKFIFFDNANFINKGWINRNRLLVNNEPYTFTLPLVKASQNKLINELSISANHFKPDSLLKLVYLSYKKAPYFEETYALLEVIFNFPDLGLVQFIIHSLEAIFNHLSIEFHWHLASQLLTKQSKGEAYIIELCKHLQTKQYVNATGGHDLYHEDLFAQVGIELIFLPKEHYCYRQWDHGFIENLSIIDVLMFNDKKSIADDLRSTKYVFKNMSRFPAETHENT